MPQRSKATEESSRPADVSKLFNERLSGEIQQLFKDLAMRMRYADFDHLAVETFSRFSSLAVMDGYTDLEDVEKAKRLDVPVCALDDLREMPDFKEIVFELGAEFGKLKDPRMMSSHVDDARLQDRVARRLERNALYAKDPRDSNKAAEVLIDRMTPRLTKEVQQRIVMISTQDLQMLERVEQELAAAGRPLLIEGEAQVVSEGEA